MSEPKVEVDETSNQDVQFEAGWSRCPAQRSNSVHVDAEQLIRTDVSYESGLRKVSPNRKGSKRDTSPTAASTGSYHKLVSTLCSAGDI